MGNKRIFKVSITYVITTGSRTLVSYRELSAIKYSPGIVPQVMQFKPPLVLDKISGFFLWIVATEPLILWCQSNYLLREIQNV